MRFRRESLCLLRSFIRNVSLSNGASGMLKIQFESHDIEALISKYICMNVQSKVIRDVQCYPDIS